MRRGWTHQVARRRRVRAALTAALLSLIAIALPAPAAAAFTAPGSITGSAVSSTAPSAGAPSADPRVAADFASIFAADQPELTGAGWGTCPAPVTWSLDPGDLSAEETDAAIADLTWAFAQWAPAAGLDFTFTGITSYAYADDAFTLTRVDGAPSPRRHVDIAFVTDSATTRMGGQTVGLGAPSQVLAQTHEIVNGIAVFRADHAQVANAAETRGLYLHELGHVLGLAHAEQVANVMYPLIGEDAHLGAGDESGVRAFSQPCSRS